jgi:hypothetical protein
MQQNDMVENNVDKHWRYSIATLLLMMTFALGVMVIFHVIPKDNKDIVYAIIAGMMPITALAVRDAISAQRTTQDQKMIQGLSDQVAASMPPPPVPVINTTPDVTVENADVTITEK